VRLAHGTKVGASKRVEACSDALNARACIGRIYTHLALLELTPAGVKVADIAVSLTLPARPSPPAVPLLAQENPT
jgi:acyl CoA:acetate/3-ketoacid CoA transferase beta subunit